MTIVGSALVGSPSAPLSRVPACGRRACARSGLLPCRDGRPSSGSPRCPRVSAGYANADSRSVVAPMPVDVNADAGPRRRNGSTFSGIRADQSAPVRRPAVANSLSPSSPSPRLSSSNRASEVFSEHLFQCRDVHHRLRQQLFELRVLGFQRPQLLGVGYLHAAILRAPLVERRIADAVLPACPSSKHLGRLSL